MTYPTEYAKAMKTANEITRATPLMYIVCAFGLLGSVAGFAFSCFNHGNSDSLVALWGVVTFSWLVIGFLVSWLHGMADALGDLALHLANQEATRATHHDG